MDNRARFHRKKISILRSAPENSALIVSGMAKKTQEPENY
jgi:hypothetical protein